MGVRKRLKAEQIKSAKKEVAFAKIKGCPTSPRKMRLVADLVRGKEVERAFQVLEFCQKQASVDLEKLLFSAIANWQVKNEGKSVEDAGLYIKEIYVDSATMLKRLRTAAKGRGFRIRKRSNHVTIVLGNKNV